MDLYKELSTKQYNLTIGLILLWGFLVNAIMCAFGVGLFSTWNYSAILIGYFIMCIIGICMSLFSDNPIISFIGYNLVVLPVGVILSLTVKEYYIQTVLQTFIITTIVILFMIILGQVKPSIFESLGKILSICLIVAIVGDFVVCLISGSLPTWWNLLVAALFCGYIGYDWSKAQEKRPTLDNAVDSAVELYLDIINLFIRLLGASGDSKKK